MQNALAKYIEAFEKRSPFWEPPWLAHSREQSAELFKNFGFPSSKSERWRHTNLKELASEPVKFAWPQNPQVEAVETFGEKGVEVLCVNGRLVKSSEAPPKGVAIHSLTELLQSPTLVPGMTLSDLQRWLTSQLKVISPFDHLNQSMFSDATVIVFYENSSQWVHLCHRALSTNAEFSENQKSSTFAQPLVSRSGREVQASTPEQQSVVSFPRTLIVVKDNVRAALVETFEGDTGKTVTYGKTDGHLFPGAHLHYAKVHQGRDNAYQLTTSTFLLSRHAHLNSFALSLNGKLSRQDLAIELLEEGAEAEVNGLYVGKGRDYVDNHTSIFHLAPNTVSHQLYKGILNDRAQAVFNGKIRIEKNAQKVVSSQLNKNLLLSSQAEVDTKPELEIFADDVKATHGATVGSLDQEQLFYLLSRGVPQSKALTMLAHGFIEDVLLKIACPELLHVVRKLAEEKVNVEELESLWKSTESQK